MDDAELRALIYRRIVETGNVPTRSELTVAVANPELLDEQLAGLHDAHMIVLDDQPHRLGEIRMALPFAAEPTDFRVTTAHGAWWANCAWDSLAIGAALDQDAHIESIWHDTNEPVEMSVIDGQLDRSDGHIHFQIPARNWWVDIVDT